MISDSALVKAFWEEGRLDDCPVIDMHGHMGQMNGIWFPRASAEDMLRTMDACGMSILCFSHHSALTSLELRNSLAVEAARRHPDRFKVYLVVNAHYPELLAAEIDMFREAGDVCVGFKLHPDSHEIAIDDPGFESLFGFAEDNGVPVLSHTWGNACWSGSAHVSKVLEKHPGLKLILGHSIFGEWDAAAELAHRYDNVYLDTCALLDDRGSLERFVEAGLSDRLLFGTDLPWFDPYQGIGAIFSAEISDDDSHNVLHRNAERLLGL